MRMNASALSQGRGCRRVGRAFLGIRTGCRRSLRSSGQGVRVTGGRDMRVSSRVRMSGRMIEYRAGLAAQLVSLGYTDLRTAPPLRLMAILSDWLLDRGLGQTAFDRVR